jgi:hypothetical protein
VNGNNRQPVVEILAKDPLLYTFFKISMRSSENPHVNPARDSGSDALNLPIGENSKELCLRGGRHFGNFIEKNGSLVRRFEKSWARPVGPGERAAFVAK